MLNRAAPTFALPDQEGVVHNLDAYRGKWVVLYFYPKDSTPGCTIEACAFRDHHEELLGRAAIVLGVSMDTQNSHARFTRSQRLPFPLLSDTDGSVCRAYDSFGEKKFMGRTFQGILRKTFIIDPQGIIVKIYDKVKPLGHAQEVINDLAVLQGK